MTYQTHQEARLGAISELPCIMRKRKVRMPRPQSRVASLFQEQRQSLPVPFAVLQDKEPWRERMTEVQMRSKSHSEIDIFIPLMIFTTYRVCSS